MSTQNVKFTDLLDCPKILIPNDIIAVNNDGSGLTEVNAGSIIIPALGTLTQNVVTMGGSGVVGDILENTGIAVEGGLNSLLRNDSEIGFRSNNQITLEETANFHLIELNSTGISISVGSALPLAFNANSIQLNNYKMPQLDGTINQIIQTDGAGQLSFATSSGGNPSVGALNALNSSDGVGGWQDTNYSVDTLGNISTAGEINISTGTNKSIVLENIDSGSQLSITPLQVRIFDGINNNSINSTSTGIELVANSVTPGNITLLQLTNNNTIEVNDDSIFIGDNANTNVINSNSSGIQINSNSDIELTCGQSNQISLGTTAGLAFQITNNGAPTIDNHYIMAGTLSTDSDGFGPVLGVGGNSVGMIFQVQPNGAYIHLDTDQSTTPAVIFVAGGTSGFNGVVGITANGELPNDGTVYALPDVCGGVGDVLTLTTANPGVVSFMEWVTPVTPPSVTNIPNLLLKNSAGQNVTIGTSANLTFSVSLSAGITGASWSVDTWTVPVSGMYEINLNLNIDSPHDDACDLTISINGNLTPSDGKLNHIDQCTTWSYIYNLTAGDTVVFRIDNGSFIDDCVFTRNFLSIKQVAPFAT